MLPAIYPVLRDAAAVTALLGSPPRVYRHGQAPQSVTSPYATWSVIGSPDNTFEGADNDRCRVQIDCWSDDDAQAETLGQAVRDAVEPVAHMVLFENGRDAETGRFRLMLQFDWIAMR
jgi:hypothetical protein